MPTAASCPAAPRESNTGSVWLPRLPRRAAPGSIAGVSLSQLRSFVAVAEEGNVGRAAVRLHIAQPPLSRQIRALEDELGTRLFARTPRGMALLPQGQVFLEHARAILEAVERAVVAAREASRGPGPAPRWADGG